MQVFLYFCRQNIYSMSRMDILEYIEQHISPEDDVLRQITHHTNLEVLNPHMLSGHVQGRLLSMLSKMIRPCRILELGTFTGYSALCLAEGLATEGHLITIEHNDELEATIRHNLSLSPLGQQIELVIADAKEYLNSAAIETESVDIAFIDADKREYCTYLDLVYPLVHHGGWILADNTLWDGHIIDTEYDKDKQTIGLRAFNDRVAQDNRLEKVILPIRDGLTIIRKI